MDDATLADLGPKLEGGRKRSVGIIGNSRIFRRHIEGGKVGWAMGEGGL